MGFRIGYGYDVHQLKAGEELWLGGVLVPHVKGAVGHSDADVILHVICDAMLGALALRDIGFHFPDTDPAYKGISSLVLLRRVSSLVSGAGAGVVNVDATVMAQRPKLARYIPEMEKKLAEALSIEKSLVSVKATTTEGLGFVGKEEGIAAQAVVLITTGLG